MNPWPYRYLRKRNGGFFLYLTRQFIPTFHLPLNLLSQYLVIGNGYLQHLKHIFVHFILSWFQNIPILRKIIVSYSRFLFGFPIHSFYLSLNNFPYCTSLRDLIVSNTFYLLFNCPNLLHSHRFLSTI